MFGFWVPYLCYFFRTVTGELYIYSGSGRIRNNPAQRLRKKGDFRKSAFTIKNGINTVK
jgi:hypothetical protein